MKTRRRSRGIVFEDGRPAAVILDLDEYMEMLERLEELEDLEELEAIRRQPMKFRKLEEFLQEYDPGV